MQVELCKRNSAPYPAHICSPLPKPEVIDQFVAAMASVVAAEDKALSKLSAEPNKKDYTMCAVTGKRPAEYADVRGIQRHSCRWLTSLLQVNGIKKDASKGWRGVARFSSSHKVSELAQNGTVYIGGEVPCLNCFKAKGLNGKHALCNDCKHKSEDCKSRPAFENMLEEGLKTTLGMYEVRLKKKHICVSAYNV